MEPQELIDELERELNAAIRDGCTLCQSMNWLPAERRKAGSWFHRLEGDRNHKAPCQSARARERRFHRLTDKLD